MVDGFRMSRWVALAIGAAVVALALVGLMLAEIWRGDGDAGGIRLEPGNDTLVAEGRTIYRDVCASCHGAALEGQPNWQQRKADGRLPAPPHDASGHTWHHPDNVLFLLTKHGPSALITDRAYPSDMPGYDGVLSDRAIVAVLSYIKSTWPQDIQVRHDALNARAAGG